MVKLYKWKTLRELELDEDKKQWKTAEELSRMEGTKGGGVIIGKEKSDPSPLANVPKRLRKFCTHRFQSKVSNLNYLERKTVEDWLKNKEDLGLSYQDLEDKVYEEFGEEISREALRQHLIWMRERDEVTLADAE